jgi:hypothetical protein
MSFISPWISSNSATLVASSLFLRFELLRVGVSRAASSTGPASLSSGPASLSSGPASLSSGPASLSSGPASLSSGPAALSSGLRRDLRFELLRFELLRVGLSRAASSSGLRLDLLAEILRAALRDRLLVDERFEPSLRERVTAGIFLLYL